MEMDSSIDKGLYVMESLGENMDKEEIDGLIEINIYGDGLINHE